MMKDETMGKANLSASSHIFERRIICIFPLIMESLPGVVGGIFGGVGVVLFGCVLAAVVGGFWRPGESVQNIFVSRSGFGRGGAVDLQADQGFSGVKPEKFGGAYTYGVGQGAALFNEAVRLAAEAERCGCGAVGGIGGIQRGKYAVDGVLHGFSPCQQVVDSPIVGVYRPESSGQGLSLSSPYALRLWSRSDDAGILSEFPGISFSGSGLVSFVR